MELIWKDITFEDKDILEQFYQYKTSRGCELSFSNNYLWAPHYGTQWGIVSDCLVFYNPKRDTVSFPIGKNPYGALDMLMKYFEEHDKGFALHLVTREQFEELEKHYPDRFSIEYQRDVADYIYDAVSLGTLAGKKLHAKRNHINRFIQNYPEWSYEAITDANLEECIAMAQKWREQNRCDEDKDKSAEFCVTLRALKKREELGLVGGAIRTRDGIVAFSLGAPLTEDTFVVHIEKAFADVQGAYPIINREFVLHAAEGYPFINREEDMGEEGLRKAKMSYNPAILLEKGVVRLI